MKRFNFLLYGLLAVALFLGVSQNVQAQATLPSTTLSAAVTTASTTTLQLAAASAGSPTITIAKNSVYLYVDREYMSIVDWDSTNKIATVARGQSGTIATPHVSGATVLFGPAKYFVGSAQGSPFGAFAGGCTRTDQIVLPLINVVTGTAFDCQGGQWAQGAMVNEGLSKFALGRICTGGGNGAVPLATAGTNTTLAAATSFTYVASIFVPETKLVTGISVLAGGTAGAADHWEVALYPGVGGARIIQSATATSAASTNAFLDIPFTSPYLVVGPARYFVGFQTSGTTDKIQTQFAANSFGDVLTQKPASTVYGTFPSLTAPTTFTDVVGPVVCAYN